MYTFAKLNEGQVAELQQFEQKEELKVVALTDLKLQAQELDPDKLKALKEFEQKFGGCLVAVR